MVSESFDDRVCLDFGTAFSKASVYVEGQARPLALGEAGDGSEAFLTPSVMFVDNGRILFGPAAQARARAAAPGRDPILSFKTIFAARDLENALSLKIKPSIDPTATLRHRDALVLYLAYLDQLIRKALLAALPQKPELASAPRRYTTPIWRTAAEGDRVMGRLFDEAAIVSEQLGRLLMDQDGVSIAHARAALDKSAVALGLGQLEGGVFEAHAAAAAYAAFAEAPKRFILVLDMGAGTTDFAGFERIGGDGQLLSELGEARQSCGLAGDEIDDIIIQLLMQKLKTKDPASQARVWRQLRLSARDLKRDLFAEGRAVFANEKAKLRLERSELFASNRFKDYVAALTDITAASVRAVAQRARAASADEITLLLAGGGANLGFLEALGQNALKAGGAPRSSTVERFGQNWRLGGDSHEGLASMMPQLAISLGGALAVLDRAPRKALAPGSS